MVTLAWAVGATVFFRTSLLSRFDVVNGGVGDSQLIVYMHEHLFRWLQGHASFGSPPIFYPQPNVLGYTDAFVLDLLPYAGWRLLGADPFLSMQLTAIMLSALCFVCTFHIFARQLGVQAYIALASALLITFPNNLFFKVSGAHINFFDIYYVPLIVLLVLAALKSFPQATARALVLMAIAAALYALLFATSYYVAWLLAFTVLIALVHTAIKFRAETLDFLRTKRRALIPYLGAAFVGFAAAIAPFLLIYLPVLSVHPARDFGEYIGHAPFPYDVINVTGSNLIWGHLVTAFLGAPRAASPEQALAVTPLMATVFITWAYLRRNTPDLDGSKLRAIFVSAAAAVAILSWLITAKIGTFSAFWIPFHIIPGGSAIRAGDRIQLLCSGFIVAGLALLLDSWSRRANGSDAVRRQLVTAAVLAVCLIEQLNLYRGGFDRAGELARLAAVPAPPTACQVVLTANAGQRPPWQTDAMWNALQVGLPTINGDSGWLPPGWRLWDPSQDYFAMARDWIARSGITRTVCLYDQATRVWSPFSP
jgi:hypothetical protein